jgi:uncharacterized protein
VTPDVNVLVAAFIQEHRHHAQARRWLTNALAACASGVTLALLPMVAAGFIRVVTNPRVHPFTIPTAQAFGFLTAMLRTPGVWMPDVGPEWPLLEALCVERRLRGSIVSDAWIAAAVKANDLHLVTFDDDFRHLLRPDQFTVLPPEHNVQERRAPYRVQRSESGIALAA